MEFDAKMASILADGLYSNKILAVIRELSANAYDAHVAAENGEPFSIHLPTTIEPWFEIKDYGTGLTENQIESIYTTYGKSTKTSSNKLVGQLGLGSKSPFAYTDAFTLLSRFDGTEYVYSMFKDDAGMPSFAKMGENKTDEKNGLTIQIPVKQTDFRKFEEECFKFFCFQSNLPLFNKQFKFEEPKISTKDWSYYKFPKERSSSYSYAKMGCVVYPIAVEYESVLPLVLNFEIGELDITASREELAYTEKTINAIKHRYDLANNQMFDMINADLAKEDTVVKAIQLFLDKYKMFMPFVKGPVSIGSFGSLYFGQIKKKYEINYKGGPLVCSVKASDFYTDPKKTLCYHENYNRKKDTFSIFLLDFMYSKIKVQSVRSESWGGLYIIPPTASGKTVEDLIECLGISDIITSKNKYSCFDGKNVTNDEVDFEKGGIYARYNFSYGLIEIGERTKIVSETYLERLSFMYDKLPKNIILTNNVDKFKNNPKWILLDDIIKDYLIAEKDFILTTTPEFNIECLRASKASSARKFIGNYSKINQKVIRNFADECGIKGTKLDHEYEYLTKIYPLLTKIREINVATKYVDTMDEYFSKFSETV